MKRGVWLLVVLAVRAASPLAAQEPCRLVETEAAAIHACVTGQGPVTLVLAAGAGLTSGTWSGVLPRLTSEARVVTFDRPGLGRSLPGRAPRTPTRIATELHEVLQSLGVTGPIVLVGHSMGGVHVLRYATLHPARVAGVVLLDTPPPGFEEARMTLLTPPEQEERRRVRAAGLMRVPEAVRMEREGAEDPSEWDLSAFPDAIPLTVVVADSQNFGDLGSQEAHRRLWLEGSGTWVELSTEGRLVVAEGSGHMVHRDRSDLVIDEVLRMLAVRDLRESAPGRSGH